MQYTSDVELGHALAMTADKISLSYFRAAYETQRKKDGTEVTEADLAVEEALIGALRTERPNDSILAEESGMTSGSSTRRWIIDPIDGTTWFMEGKRNWGTHIALEVDGVLQFATFTRPTEHRRWWAVRGHGAYVSDSERPQTSAQRIRVSSTTSLRVARVGGYIPPESPAIPKIRSHAIWFDDEVSVMAAVVEGRIDAVLDEGGNPWDQAPGALIIQEAGGRYSDRDGGTRIDQSWGLFSNGALHGELLQLLAPRELSRS